MTLVQSELKKMYIRVDEPLPDYLCFTANTASSQIRLKQNTTFTPQATLETSIDKETWTSYTIGSWITLSNIGDKVYFRNTSETTVSFTPNSSKYYIFQINGSIAASGDITSLINKNCTDTLVGNYCYYNLFANCTGLTSAPKLPATTLTDNCYDTMFISCSNLETLPELPATTLTNYCYYMMFNSCEKIKLSTTQTGEYQTPYRIPKTGTGTTATNSLYYMFYHTGGTGTSTPTINTTYYTSNTLV